MMFLLVGAGQEGVFRPGHVPYRVVQGLFIPQADTVGLLGEFGTQKHKLGDPG